MLTAYGRAMAADWMQKRYKLIEQEYIIRYAELRASIRYIFVKKKMRIKIRHENMLESFIDIHRLVGYFKNRKKKNLKKKFIKKAVALSGMYFNIWRYVFKTEDVWDKIGKERVSVIRLAIGPQQVRFTLYMFKSSRPTTHATVGSVLNYKLTIERFGNYRPIQDRDEAVREAERKRTKKYIRWFKEEYRYDNMRGVMVRKKIIKRHGYKSPKEKFMDQLAKRALELKSRPKTKRNKIKLDADSVVYNKRGNPKTEPVLEKHFRRKFSSWLWFLRIIAKYIKKKLYKVDRRLVLHVSGVDGDSTPVYEFIFKTFEKYKILYFLLKFDIKYAKPRMKKIASIKKRVKKQMVRDYDILWD